MYKFKIIKIRVIKEYIIFIRLYNLNILKMLETFCSLDPCTVWEFKVYSNICMVYTLCYQMFDWESYLTCLLLVWFLITHHVSVGQPCVSNLNKPVHNNFLIYWKIEGCTEATDVLSFLFHPVRRVEMTTAVVIG